MLCTLIASLRYTLLTKPLVFLPLASYETYQQRQHRKLFDFAGLILMLAHLTLLFTIPVRTLQARSSAKTRQTWQLQQSVSLSKLISQSVLLNGHMLHYAVPLRSSRKSALQHQERHVYRWQ
jgi:hypothetical protein